MYWHYGKKQIVAKNQMRPTQNETELSLRLYSVGFLSSVILTVDKWHPNAIKNIEIAFLRWSACSSHVRNYVLPLRKSIYHNFITKIVER